MLTRVLVVQPLFSVIVDESGDQTRPVCGPAADQGCASAPAVGEAVAANGQIIAALSAFLQQLAPLLLQILPLFIKPNATPASTN
jgi:hypothetical protein